MTICTTDKCGQGRRKCPSPEFCQANSDGSDPGLPIVMFEKPYQWIQDLFYEAVWWTGTVFLVAAIVGLIAGIAYSSWYR